MGVGDQEGAQNSVHDGVERAGGKGSDGERDQTDADSPGKVICEQISPPVGNWIMTNLSKVQW